MKTYHVAAENSTGWQLDKRELVRTGEFRKPRKGEWFLSGAIPEGYLAPNDLTTPYHILTSVVSATRVVS